MGTENSNQANYLVTYQACAEDGPVSGRTFAYFEYSPPRSEDVTALESNIQIVTGYNSVFVTGLFKLTVEEE